MDIWWCPPAITTASWNDPSTGMFTTAMEPLNDVRMNFRVLDVNTAPINGQNDAGSLCLNQITIDRIAIDDLVASSAPYDVSNITASTHVIGSIFGTTSTAGGSASTLYTFSGGDLTIVPNTTGSMLTGAWAVEVVNIDVGDAIVDLGTPSTLPDNWPIQWNDDELLMGTYGITAPNAQSQTTPPDAIMLQWDAPTNELLAGSGTVSTDNTAGMPKFGVSDELVSFLYTHTSTASSILNGDRLRLRMVLLCSGSVNSGGSTTNLGGVTITSQQIAIVPTPAEQ